MALPMAFAALSAALLLGCGGKGKTADSADQKDNINLSGTMPIIKDPSRFPKLKMAVVIPAHRIVPTGQLKMIQKLKDITGINTEWLAKTGKSMPKTVDEFTAVLRAFRDAGDLNGNGKDDEIPYALDFTCHDMFGSYNTFHQFPLNCRKLFRAPTTASRPRKSKNKHLSGTDL
jgi:ABC-type glycerol-3-phosphate transport system substrate-binding protein